MKGFAAVGPANGIAYARPTDTFMIERHGHWIWYGTQNLRISVICRIILNALPPNI